MSKPTAPPPPGALQIVYASIDALRPSARNARTHSPAQLAKLENSLAEYGWTNPIAVAGLDVIAGHGRLAAAKALRDKGRVIPGHPALDVVPIIDLSHLTVAQRRAYMLADNRLALDAGWDEDLLSAELADLQLEGFDLAFTGFSPDEIERFISGEAPPAPSVPPGPAPAASAYAEQYGVIVICGDEEEQKRIYGRLKAEGLSLRVVTT